MSSTRSEGQREASTESTPVDRPATPLAAMPLTTALLALEAIVTFTIPGHAGREEYWSL